MNSLAFALTAAIQGLRQDGHSPSAVVITDSAYRILNEELRQMWSVPADDPGPNPQQFKGIGLAIVDDDLLPQPFVIARTRPK